jgi:hypothetical protein
MRTPHHGLVALAAVMALALAGGTIVACGGSGPDTSASPTPEASTSSPAATVTPTPTVSPSPLDTANMSEEQLAKAVETSMLQTAQATREAAQVAADVSADGTVSKDEAAQLVASAQYAWQLVGSTNAVFQAYLSQYGAWADALTSEMEQMTQYLMDVDEELGTLIEYAQSAEATAENLAAMASETAATAKTTADQIAAQTQQWASKLAAARATWEAAARDIKATKGADTRAGALQMAGVYLETLNRSLRDGKLSNATLQSIFQASANAVASLKAQGGQLAKLGAEVESLTVMLAKGDLPQVKAKLPQIESLFP